MRSRSAASLLALALVAPVSAFAADPAPPKAPVPVVSVPTYENTTCPIMGKPASKAMFADTPFGRVYVCCPPCIARIKADPERSTRAAYPVVKKAGNVVDPVTGAPVGDKPVVITLQGWEIALASAESEAWARANTQIVLTKALRPDVVDVGNGTDPVTGQPIAPNTFVLVDKDLIRLSSTKSIEEVRRDPEKARTAAKAIAAKEAEERAKAKGADQPK